MSITQDEAAKVAHLARLAVSEEQLTRYTSDLVKVLDVVAKMNEVDTEGVEPMSHAFDIKQRLRPDEVTEPNNREALMQNAPDQTDGVFLVPKVME